MTDYGGKTDAQEVADTQAALVIVLGLIVFVLSVVAFVLTRGN